MPKPSTTKPEPELETEPATPPDVVEYQVKLEATDYINGKIPTLTIIGGPDDEYLKKMEGNGWNGYATITKTVNGGPKITLRSMHVSANQARDLFALAAAGQDPVL